MEVFILIALFVFGPSLWKALRKQQARSNEAQNMRVMSTPNMSQLREAPKARRRPVNRGAALSVQRAQRRMRRVRSHKLMILPDIHRQDINKGRRSDWGVRARSNPWSFIWVVFIIGVGLFSLVQDMYG